MESHRTDCGSSRVARKLTSNIEQLLCNLIFLSSRGFAIPSGGQAGCMLLEISTSGPAFLVVKMWHTGRP